MAEKISLKRQRWHGNLEYDNSSEFDMGKLEKESNEARKILNDFAQPDREKLTIHMKVNGERGRLVKSSKK